MKYFSFILFILIGCSSSLPDESIPLADHLKIGMDLLDQEKFVKAQDEFKFILSRGTGTDYGDDAQFFLAESYFLNQEYILSIQEYENLTRKMAFSPYFEKSRFRICEAYRIESPNYYNDQSYTEKALERYREFLDDFPESEHSQIVTESMDVLRNKLAKKIFETGVLYMKMDEFEPARMSFSAVIDQYYDTDIMEQVHFEVIKSYFKEGNIQKAEKHWVDKGQSYISNEELINEITELFSSKQ
jgi:outer membrane protein assembly factor BamD